MVARHLHITGKVQGVFYRATTKQEAERRGVAGWVRNCEDGSVEAHVEGSRIALDELVDRLSDGPPAARVAAVEAEDVDPQGCEGFSIKR
ncbi:acylphosphatase [Sphingomicrobium astaxanthinifaciens]|uniref:acylphosphatase n=1 Tax=Sphingomicrobium astaxanthinifaciens TaxID=1227949 RepID=UPI001FCC5ED2|nr:acylphosphatase [Sphingomicrobium astaxanthinifaciens]MCJ7420824.1 acylphosphatase [Sphingomicrobium astaxanthinifaciens]